MTTRHIFRFVAIVGATVLTTGGCTPRTARGVIVMTIDDSEAHIGLGAREVGPGDQLTLFRYFCGGSKFPSCHKRVIGSGKVVEVLNDSYSVARFDSKINLREGDIVERAPGGQ